jgi:glycosyltransferase involved in cell wall biosynthesis
MSNAKKMHIVFLSSWFPTGKEPFNGNFVIRHSEAVALYADVSFINVTSDPLSNKDGLDIAPGIYIIERKISQKIPKPLVPIVKLYYLWKLFKKAKKEKGKPDVIHSNVIFPGAFYAWFLKILTNTPFIVSEHWTGYLPESANKPGWFKLLLVKLLAKKASAVCPVSNHLKDAMMLCNIKANFRVVPNVVNTDLFNIKNKTAIKTGFQFLHVSSLIDTHKNISGLISAVKILSKNRKDFKLHIITCSRERNWEKIVDEQGLSCYVEFHYSYSPAQIASFFRETDAFVLFSNYETFGVVVIESFASGVPVISTNIKPIDELVNDERGKLIEVGNYKELARTMSDFIDACNRFNKDKIRKFATQNFSYESIGQQFLNIYKETIKLK